MAKNIMVNEGSSLKIVKNVSKLSTLLQDNTEQLWVPEDEIKLVPKTIIQDGTYVANREIGNPYGYSEVTVSGVGNLIIGETARKTFNQNGIYYANEDSSGPFYGYSEVTVNVDSYSGGSSGGSGGQPTSGTVGKDPDGDDAMVVVNPDTEHLDVVKIPSRIKVITPPYNPYVIYNDGQSIVKDGMVVMAYTENDEEWGEVPLDELVLFPTETVYNEQQDMGGGGYATIDDSTYSSYNLPIPFYHKDMSIYNGSSRPGTCIKEGISDAYLVPLDGEIRYWYSLHPATVEYTAYWDDGDIRYSTQTLTDSGTTYISGTTFYYGRSQARWGWMGEVFKPDSHSYDATNFSAKSVATILFDGITESTFPAGSEMTIRVSWVRPGDGQILSDTFSVYVAPPVSIDNDWEV